MPPSEKKLKIAVIGGGPIGLEAALYGLKAGYDVRVFEKGEVGFHIKKWSHVDMFSPWRMNTTPLGIRELRLAFPEKDLPAQDTFLKGREFLEQYVSPLASLPLLGGRICENTEVRFVGKERLWKGKQMRDIPRDRYPFRIQTQDKNGVGEVHLVDAVIDSGGVYSQPNFIGNGGLPAFGEEEHRDQIFYYIPDVLGADQRKFAGKRTLLIGGGPSAATTAVMFRNLMKNYPGTSLTWLSLATETPLFQPDPQDPLPLRVQLFLEANRFFEEPPEGFLFIGGSSVEAIVYDSTDWVFHVRIVTPEGHQFLEVDQVIANVGYRPDTKVFRELQVEESFATDGPMKVSAELRKISGEIDLPMRVQAMDTSPLQAGEPNYFIIGAKSYGRNSTFLLRTGHDQIRRVFSILQKDSGFDLYREG